MDTAGTTVDDDSLWHIVSSTEVAANASTWSVFVSQFSGDTKTYRATVEMLDDEELIVFVNSESIEITW